MILRRLDGTRRVVLSPEGEEVSHHCDVNCVWRNVLMLLQDGKEGGGEERMAGGNTGVSVAEEEG